MAELEPWMAAIQPDQLPHPWQAVARTLGVEIVLRLSAMFGGTTLYVPKLDRLVLSLRDEQIRREFDGGNYRTLAARYNLTESRVRSIVNGGLKKRLPQGDLFN